MKPNLKSILVPNSNLNVNPNQLHAKYFGFECVSSR